MSSGLLGKARKVLISLTVTQRYDFSPFIHEAHADLNIVDLFVAILIGW
jgi:hypothetical protein